MHPQTIVTIWSTYGPYHLARVRALEKAFGGAEIVCYSHCASSETYEFFNLAPGRHVVLVDKPSSKLRFFESVLATWRALQRTKPELVLTCGYERPETLASILWTRCHRSVTFLMLDNQYDDRRRNHVVEWIKTHYLKIFNGFIYGGDSHKNYLRRLKVPPNREVQGYNCVDNDAIADGADKERRNGERRVEGDYFLCIARLIQKKNLVRLIQAHAGYVREVGRRNSGPWSLVICGEGPERPAIERAIRDVGAGDTVKLAGRIDDFRQIIQYCAFARALVLASHENEQWGLVVNEAMASGLPVLVSKQCGCASSLVRDGINGFTFDGTSVEQLTRHMLWMHQNHEKLEPMGRHSREIVAEYSPDHFAQNVKDLYARCTTAAAG